MVKYYLLAVLAALMLPINNWLFWPLLVVFWAASTDIESKKIYALAAVSGLLADLLLGRSLGVSALFLLVSSGLLYSYRLFWRMNFLALAIVVVGLSFIEKFLWG